MNSVDIKTAKPGIYYRVFFGSIEKIDFVRYFERTKKVLTTDFGDDAPYYVDKTIGCYEYKRHSNNPNHSFGLEQKDYNNREVFFFKDFEDAKEYVIEHYYGGEIQKLKKEIEKMESKLEEFKSKTVEDKIWLT